MITLRMYHDLADDPRVRVVGLSVQEPFSVYIKAALVVGAVLASPFVFYFIWDFVAVGLYPHEKKYVHTFLPISLALFLAGVALAFFLVFRFVLAFLFQFYEWMGIDPDPRITDWLSFVLILPLGFGISFQLPLVMLFLERIGVFTVRFVFESLADGGAGDFRAFDGAHAVGPVQHDADGGAADAAVFRWRGDVPADAAAEGGRRSAERLTHYRGCRAVFPSVFAWGRLRYDGGRGGIGHPTFKPSARGATDMCAKKATSAPAKKPAAKASSKPAENGQAAAAPASAKPVTKSLSAKTVPVKAVAKVTTDRSLSNHDIGAVAGEIWQLLSAGETQTLAAVKKSVKAPADVVAAAIGWLAREDKLEFTTSGKTVKLSLK